MIDAPTSPIKFVKNHPVIVSLFVVAALIIGAGAVFRFGMQPQASVSSAVPVNDRKTAQAGYSLIAPLNNRNIYLVDNNGKQVHEWKTDHYAGVVTKLLDAGSVLRTYEPDTTYFSMGGAGGGIQILDWDGNVTWDYQYNSEESQLHHDATMMPNGHILTLAWVKIPGDQAIAAGVDPAHIDSASNSTWSDRIIEIDPKTNQIVWQWDAFDHLVQDFDSEKANYGTVAQNVHKINANYYEYAKKPDWLHTNSVDYNASSDQIMISAREFNEFWIIDHSTTTAEAATSTGGKSGMGGDLLYRYGNPAAYNHGDQSNRTLFLQHDAQWITDGLPGAGNVLLFDNGDKNNNREYSSAIELTLPSTGATYAQDERGGYKAAEIVWEYGIITGDDVVFSNIMGGVQRLPNGNTLLTDAVHGRAVEVTKDKKRAWVYVNPIHDTNRLKPGETTNNVFRIYKYSADSPELKGKV